MGDQASVAMKPDQTKEEWGCVHYKRKSKFVTPCCSKVYVCRFCHDDNENHPVNRKAITELVCQKCNIRQPVQAACQNCHVRFGKYICLICNLFDDEDKKQYHCDGCGICRCGGRDNFFHCQRCDMCLPIQLQNGHRCLENISRTNCAVCLDDIHTSRYPSKIPDCGHLLHTNCFEQLIGSGHYACPTCQTSLLDMTQLWKYLDREVELTLMPPECQNYVVNILCKDCHVESSTKFHVVGLKCRSCGSYNTCRVQGAVQPANEGNDETGEASASINDNPPNFDGNGVLNANSEALASRSSPVAELGISDILRQNSGMNSSINSPHHDSTSNESGNVEEGASSRQSSSGG